MEKRIITILIDNPRSWFVPYGQELAGRLRTMGHEVRKVGTADDLPEGDIAFFLSCERIIGADLRSRNTHNLVIHGSALPKGKGWSPMAWQILGSVPSGCRFCAAAVAHTSERRK